VKFDDLLAQYLYEKKSLQLQGIGTFELDKNVSLPNEQDKQVYYPIEGLTFIYNTKDVTNEDLVTFLVKKLGKIQPLVRSDLDSYLSNIKQFINIGKPYTIEGIGTLHKNNQGTYEFTPGNFLPVKEELSPKRESGEHSIHPAERRSKRSGGGGGKGLALALVIIASLAALGGIGWGVYTFFLSDESSAVTTDSTQDALPSNAQWDSAAKNATTDTTQTSPTSDSTKYKMVFETTPVATRVNSRTAFLRKEGMTIGIDTLKAQNPVQYRMYVPVTSLPGDTARIKDSLSRIFDRAIKVQRY
jgi:nucleoid DNA-binding protein